MISIQITRRISLFNKSKWKDYSNWAITQQNVRFVQLPGWVGVDLKNKRMYDWLIRFLPMLYKLVFVLFLIENAFIYLSYNEFLKYVNFYF